MEARRGQADGHTVKPLVVAQCPGSEVIPARALEGSRSERTLARLMGVADVFDVVDTVNLLPRNPGAVWPLQEASDRAMDILHQAYAEDRERVVLLGGAVRTAFRSRLPMLKGVDWFTWTSVSVTKRGRWVEVACSPHPSGRSRAWNDVLTKLDGDTFWKALVGSEV